MAKGYTLDELLKMGAKPVAQPQQQGGLTREQLLQQGVKPYDPRDALKVHYNTPPPKKGFLAKAGSLGKGLFNAVTSSEQTLGKGLSTVFDPTSQKTVSDISQQEQGAQQQLINAIRAEKDSTKKNNLVNFLKKQYGVAYQPTATELNEGFGLSNKQVIGAALGTALDVALAGSYGKAAQGAKTGELLTKSGSTAGKIATKLGIPTTEKVVANPIAQQIVKKSLGETLGQIGKESVIKSAKGAAIGYGYDVSQNLQSDKGKVFKPGAGTLIGGAIPLLSGALKAGVAITKEEAPRIINSLVKPRQANFAYGKNPGRAVAEMGITGNSIEDLGNNVSKAKKDIGQQIGEVYSNPANAGLTINATDQIDKIDKAIEKAAKGGKNNQGIVDKLYNLKESLLYDFKPNADGQLVRMGDVPKDLSALNPLDAFDLKQKIADATQFTGNVSDDKAVNSTLKSLYGGLKDTLNEAVGKNNPEILKLNERFGDLTSAEIAIQHRSDIIQRGNLKGLSETIWGSVAAATQALLTGHVSPETFLVGASAAGIEKALSSTPVKTRIAAWAASESPSKISAVLEKNPGIKQTLFRLVPKLASRLGQK